MGVLGYSTTPGSNNNALAGVGSLAENVMPIKQINDAQRQQLADIAQLYSDIVTGIYTTGTSSAYLAATASGHTVYNNTMALRLRFHVDSAAGAVTVNVNGLGAKSLKIFATTGSRDPVVGEIKADMAYDCVYIAALNCIVVTDPVVPTVDLSSRQPLDADLTAIAGLTRTRGDIIRGGATAWEDLALGATNTVLTSNGTDAIWQAPAGGLGVSQTWQAPVRVHSTSYQNTTGKPIQIAARMFEASGAREFQVSSDNATWISVLVFQGTAETVFAVIPDTWYYRINSNCTITFWRELR